MPKECFSIPAFSGFEIRMLEFRADRAIRNQVSCNQDIDWFQYVGHVIDWDSPEKYMAVYAGDVGALINYSGNWKAPLYV